MTPQNLVFTFFNPLPDDKILGWFKLKQSADDKSKFDVNSRKFSKLVENTVGKGEIARYERFLLFQQCFQMACFAGASKSVIVWERVNSHEGDHCDPLNIKLRENPEQQIKSFKPNTLTLYQTIPTFDDPENEAL